METSVYDLELSISIFDDLFILINNTNMIFLYKLQQH